MLTRSLRFVLAAAAVLLTPVVVFSQTTATSSTPPEIAFSAQKSVYIGPSAGYVDVVAVGDVNGDGNVDLIANIHGAPGKPNVDQVFLGNGKGGFTPGETVPDSGLGFNDVALGSVQLIDVNGDGKLDLVEVDPGSVDNQSCDVTNGTLTVYLGDGHGRFSKSYGYTLPPQYFLYSTTGDFNHDGRPDFALESITPLNDCVNAGADLYVFLNKGDGKFASPAVSTLDSAVSEDMAQAAAPLNSVSTVSKPFVAGDFNGDGKGDLAYVPFDLNGSEPVATDAIQVLNGKGNGTFSTGTKYTFDNMQPGSLLAADLNRDGRTDLVACLAPTNGGAQRVATLLAKKTGGFYWSSAVSVAGCGMALTDVNGDGTPDLVISVFLGSSSSGVQVAAGEGNGRFASPKRFAANVDDLDPVFFAAPLKKGALPDLFFSLQSFGKPLPTHSYVGLLVNESK